MNHRLYSFQILLLLFASCAYAEPDYSLDAKIGQRIMVGFYGTDAQNDPDLLRHVRRSSIGGVVFFNRRDHNGNSEAQDAEFSTRLHRRIEDLQQASAIPLFIAIDQEGGKVARLTQELGFPPALSAQTLGTRDDQELTRAEATSIARTLRRLGFNINLAPVVDLNTNPDNPIIGHFERSYSADPEKVVRHARLFIDAHHNEGILCVLKHFPGHGSATHDSHLGTVDVSSTWSPQELIPFRDLIETGEADAVMTAHIFNNQIDAKHPATLSKKTITELLRNEMNFSGLVFTDDLMMGSIKDNYSFEESIAAAINAGADILLFSEDGASIVEKTIKTIRDAIDAGKIEKKHIEESFARIMEVKRRYQSPD